MNKGKRIFGVVIVSLLLIGSVAMVSAGFLDIFKFGDDSELEGELANLEGATATITIETGAAPEIVFVSEVDDGGRSSSANTILPNYKSVNGGITPVTFSFIAQSEGGTGVLYTDSSGDASTNAKLT